MFSMLRRFAIQRLCDSVNHTIEFLERKALFTVTQFSLFYRLQIVHKKNEDYLYTYIDLIEAT